jgi:hypothetical protein
LSSSVATTTLGIKNRVDSIESKTGSYATTGSNIFQGNQTITGSLYISQDLIVAGSSSIQNISSSILNIGDNIITVNALNPSVRFGGLAVIDSGSSPQVSGSMLFDSVNDQWIFIHQNQSSVTSSILLMGPQTFNNVGNEAFPTNNRLLKSVNAEHLGDSNVSDDGTTVTILSNAIVNGTFSSTGTTLVSGSSQITHDSTTGYVANRHIDHTAVSISAGNGLSGGGDISTTRTLTLDTGSVHFLDGVKKELNTEGVISGSSQVLNGSGVWSGSAQLPSGVVSGSSQVLNGTTIHSGSFFNGISVVSGSAQVSFNGITDKPTLVSGSSQVSFNGITDKPTLVSGSSQITFSGISGLPTLVSGSSQISHDSTTGYVANRHIDHTAVSISAGNGLSGGGDISATRTISLDTTSATFTTGVKTKMNTDGVVSGSSQISFGGITGVPSGLVSGSSQITYGSLTGIPSGIVSGSSQITFGSISSIPSGLVSGSSQISLTSTTGFGTYLNQALLTTSTPTFSTVSATTFTGALSGNATTASSISGFNNPATAATANTIVYRDGSGDIYGRYLFGSYHNSTDDISTGTITHIMAKFGDNYHRSATAAKVQSFLGLGSLAYSSATIPTNNNQLTNGAGYITSYSETDTLGTVTNRGSSTSQNIVFSNGRKGLVGVYDAAQTQAIFAMGAAYILTDGGASATIGNHYGLAWSYNPDYGGAGNNPQSKAGLNHQLLHMQAGVTTTAIGSGIWTSGGITCGTILPLSNNNYNLGSASLGWANVYTNDLHLSNMNKPEGNDIDGTNGTWTIQEGAENLYIINNNNGKKYKIDLTEII